MCVRVCVCVYMCIHIYIYIYIYMNGRFQKHSRSHGPLTSC